MPVVTTSFKTNRRMYPIGMVVEADDPVVKSHSQFFDGGDKAPVEQATANPGEKRATKRPAKKTAASKDDE